MFSINLSNYRSFQNEEFNFSKINILIGENSSGKSSLFKLLLALKQTLLLPISREINLQLSGEYADLGNFKETVYYHNQDLPIKLSFGFFENYYTFFEETMLSDRFDQERREKQKKNLKYVVGNGINKKTTLNLTITKDLDKHESIKTIIENQEIGYVEIIHSSTNSHQEIAMLFEAKCTIKFIESSSGQTYFFENVNYSKDGFLSIIEGPTLKRSISKYLEIEKNSELLEILEIDNPNTFLATRIYYKIAYFLITQNFLKYHLEKIDYINPINAHPSRFYLNKDAKQSTSIKNIEDFVDFVSKTDDVSKRAFEDLKTILKNMNIAEDIEIIKDKNLPVKELRVKIKDLLSNISDVGYGVSLQLPLLLKSLLSDKLSSRRDTILLIEQPEVHLHPRLHSQLIETLISLSKHTTYFVETHSEHIIRKLQVLVKEKKFSLTSEDVTIHYLRRIDKKTVVTSHRINEDGTLEPRFPSGFFDNSYLLTKELLD